MQDPILTPIFTALVIEGLGVSATFAVGTATFSTASVLSTATLLAGSVALSVAFAAKPSAQGGHQALNQAIAPVIAGRGECRISGAYTLWNVNNGVSIDVVALHAGKIGGFVDFYLHDDEVEIIDSGGGKKTVLTGADNGLKADGRYQGGHVYLYTRLGEPTETAYAEVTANFPTQWDSSHRGDDTASLALFCVGVSTEAHAKTYPNGKPEPSVRANLAPVYDGRDPAQDPDDPATWSDYDEWDDATTYAQDDRALQIGAVYISRVNGNVGNAPRDNQDKWKRVDTNPILGLISYLTDSKNGLGHSHDILIAPALTRLMARADKCDVAVLRKNGTYESRYTCSTWWNGESDHSEVIADFLLSCDGWIDRASDGTLIIEPGVYETPDCEPITDDFIIGLSVDFSAQSEDRADKLTLSFTSPAHKFKTVPGETWPTRATVGKKALPFSPKGVQSHAQLRRLAKRQFVRGNSPLRGTLTTHLGGLQWQGWRWVPIQSSLIPELNDAVIEVRRMRRDFAGQCSFDFLIIDPATIDAWNAAAEEGRAPPTPSDIADGVMPVPQNVQAIAGGDPPFHIDISWDESDLTDPALAFLTWRVRYRLHDDGTGDPGSWSYQNFDTALVAAGRMSVTLFPTTADIYDIQVASVGSRGSLSDWSDMITVSTAGNPLLDDDSVLLSDDDVEQIYDEVG